MVDARPNWATALLPQITSNDTIAVCRASVAPKGLGDLAPKAPKEWAPFPFWALFPECPSGPANGAQAVSHQIRTPGQKRLWGHFSAANRRARRPQGGTDGCGWAKTGQAGSTA